MFIQSILHLVSTKGDVLGPTYTKSKETKISLVDKEAKPSKK